MPLYLVISGDANWAYSVELHRGESYRIGRADDNDIVIKDRRVSSYHARLTCGEATVEALDLESRNGTFVNDHRHHHAQVKPGDRIMVGRTTLNLVESLDSEALSGAAILSPRLSQPLLKTEVKKLRDIIDHMETIHGHLVDGTGPQTINKIAGEISSLTKRLREVEIHTRALISTNHFHEIFLSATDPDELFRDALRFIVGAAEAENAVLGLKAGGSDGQWELVSTVGLSVVSWQSSGIPAGLQVLVDRAVQGLRTVYLDKLSQDREVLSAMARADARSVLVAPIVGAGGEVHGFAYLDNISRPERLSAAAGRLVEGCLSILADHLQREREAAHARSAAHQQRREESTQELGSTFPDPPTGNEPDHTVI